MTIFLLAIAFFMQATAFAQNNPSGTWTLQKKERVSGPDRTNALPKEVNLYQQADSIIIESIYVEGGRDVNKRQAVPLNGQSVTTIGPRSHQKYVKSMKWSDDRTIMVLTVVTYQPDHPNEVAITRVETWGLSPNGKQLNLHKKTTDTRGETSEAKAVYVRKFVSEE